jgi:hypothetical protein
VVKTNGAYQCTTPLLACFDKGTEQYLFDNPPFQQCVCKPDYKGASCAELAYAFAEPGEEAKMTGARWAVLAMALFLEAVMIAVYIVYRPQIIEVFRPSSETTKLLKS